MSGRPRSKRTQRVGEAVAGYLAHAGIAERVAQAGVVVRWAELVGAGVARAARAESVSADGTLYVRVASSAWRQELSLMTPEIMAKLNAGRRTGRITRIFWLVGDQDNRSGTADRRTRTPPPPKPRTPVPMTALAAPPPVSMREVAQRIIADQAGAMRRLRKPARRGEIEAVHDLRVATRRLRAALRVFRDFVAPAGGVRKRLRRLARRLGAVRDHDVMAGLLAAQLGERLGDDERRRLGRLLRAVRKKRRRKLTRLERALEATEVRALRRRARRLPRAAGLDDDAAAIGLTRAVTRLAAEVAREPAMLEAAPSEEALHRLRIAMKRLRYALEFHAGAGGLAYDAELDAARELQTCLGDLHDVDVLRAAMRRGNSAFAGPWPATSRRLRAARQQHLTRFRELRDRWRELTRSEPATDAAAAFPALEAAPVQLRLVSGGKQIASAMIR